MAASVRIEDEAFTDMRIKALGVLLGTSEFDALGRLAHLWRQATQMGKDVLPIALIAQVLDPAKLIECGLGEKKKTGVRLKGAKGRIEWLEMKRRVGRENGIKGRDFGRLGGRPRLTPKKPGEGVSENPPPAPAPAPAPAQKTKTEQPLAASPPADQKPPKVRLRNETFDAVAEVTGLDPATAGGLIGKVAATLGKAEPPYTSADVREFGRRFWELCSYAARDNRQRPTPSEIEKNIGLLRAPDAPAQTKPSRPAAGNHQRAQEAMDAFLGRGE